MRIAIVSDVHADVHALNDALAQIEHLGCDLVLCAGDLVDYASFPEETVALLRERKIPCVRGNHDRWAIGKGRPDDPHPGGGDAVGGAPTHDATGWDLSREALSFLATLPTAWDATLDGVRVAVRHASPRSDMDGIYPDQIGVDDARRFLGAAQAEVLLVGHTHIPFALETLDGGLIANPGALLRETADRERAWLYDRDTGEFAPGPAPGGGTFGVLDLPSKRFTVRRAADGGEVEIQRGTLGVTDRRRA